MKWLLLALGVLLVPNVPQKIKDEPALKEYRILSVSDSAKLVLISDLKNKTRFLLDASQAKVIIDGKESDLKSLQNYSSALVLFVRKTKAHEGVTLDGSASRIEVNKKK